MIAFFSHHFRKLRSGFSFLEVIAVIAISAIILSITVASFTTLRKSKTLGAEALSVLSLIEKARGDTLGSKDALQYSVHFETTKAVLFSGTSYSAGNSSNISVVLNSTVQIKTISLTGGGSNVTFDRLTGKTSQNGSIILSLTSSTSTIKTIAVGKTGLAEIQ